MYHYEFYNKIRKRHIGEPAFLSGIGGDWWSGNIRPLDLDGPHDLVRLGYTHGLRADPERLLLSAPHELRNRFWTEHQDLLSDHRFQMVILARLKMILISYLIRVPRLFNFHPWSPYLDIDIAMAMLNLPQDRRANRQWQRDFFAKVGLSLEEKYLKSDRKNTLDLQALKCRPVSPLKTKSLSALFDADYIEWINRHVRTDSIYGRIKNSMLNIPKIGGVMRRMGIRNNKFSAYSAYCCIKPIENLLTQGPFD